MNSKQAVDMIRKMLGLTAQSFFESKTEQGLAIKMEGELELGSKVYVSTEEGLIPAPPGVHKLEDGSEIEVDEEGKLINIKMGDYAETDAEKKESDIEKEAKKDETMSIDQKFGDMKLIDGTMIRMESDEPMVGSRVKKVSYDGTLSAISDGEYETENGKVIQISGGAIQGVQSVADNKKRKTGFVKAETADGTIVESPTFDVGESLDVVDADGNLTKAPDGEHQVVLKDESGNENKIRVITKDGKIVERQNVEEEEMSQIIEVANLFNEAIKKLEVKLDSISSKQKELENKFQKFSKEPAGERIRPAINEVENLADSKYEKFMKLRGLMTNN